MKEIDSIKHKETRAHIPSNEEAGYEKANPRVTGGNEILDIPKNPVVHRGQDPELFWVNKYGSENMGEKLTVDIRSLYRHEHIAPETLIKGLYKTVEVDNTQGQGDLFSINELFGNALEHDELDKVSEYYSHRDGWTNRLIQGDSLLVMTSLLEREGMAGQVQCVYIDPPYGIKYGGNWQMRLNDRNIKDGSDEHLSGEPEMIKAFRDTWELGIHSYLSYMRDRLLVAKELLTESGSCFVQISDENVHLLRCLMDEVFGSENFISNISVKKTGGFSGGGLDNVSDYLLWYSKDKSNIKYRELYFKKVNKDRPLIYNWLETKPGSFRKMTNEELLDEYLIPDVVTVVAMDNLSSMGEANEPQPYEFNGKVYYPSKNSHWKCIYPQGLNRLSKLNRLYPIGNSLMYVRQLNDFPVRTYDNIWTDTSAGGFSGDKYYVVQTSNKVIQRCLLMTTDPGDLVLDPTCGSGTSAYVAEQWGRRWITIDTSRIALNIAKQRLMTATFPYYYLYSNVDVETSGAINGKISKKIKEKSSPERGNDIRQGFVYEEVPHITLKSLANDEPPETETLFDKPYEDKKRLRVAGPFTVETLQNFEPVSPESLDDGTRRGEDSGIFEERIFEHLKSAGIKNGIRNEMAVFIRIERLADAFLHAEGFYNAAGGEKKAYIHIGPKFGTVSRLAVNEAVKACRSRGDADWLIILGFTFESTISNENVTTSLGNFEVTKVRMHDDLMQDGLIKKDKKAASFVTIGEPDIKLVKKGKQAVIEILGLDIYDPIKDEVKARNVEDIAYWMADTDYDSSNFVVRQVFFCGGGRDEFDKWRKGLDVISKSKVKKNAERTLKIEIDDEAFDRLYGFQSHPFEVMKGQKVAVRVISQFGEECMKVLEA